MGIKSAVPVGTVSALFFFTPIRSPRMESSGPGSSSRDVVDCRCDLDASPCSEFLTSFRACALFAAGCAKRLEKVRCDSLLF